MSRLLQVFVLSALLLAVWCAEEGEENQEQEKLEGSETRWGGRGWGGGYGRGWGGGWGRGWGGGWGGGYYPRGGWGGGYGRRWGGYGGWGHRGGYYG